MKKNPIILVLLICAGMVAICLGVYISEFPLWQLSGDTAHWGTFGDYVGGVLGTTFNFAGMILIYFTFKEERESSALQQFETTFFNMLTIHRELVKSLKGVFPISYDGMKEKQFEGEEFITKFTEHLDLTMMHIPKDFSEEETFNDIEKIYSGHFSSYGSSLGRYYRHFSHFLKYVNESQIKNKKKYFDIIQSQMSDDELFCLFYNAIVYGNKVVKPILIEYDFLENLEPRFKAFDVHKSMFYKGANFKYHS